MQRVSVQVIKQFDDGIGVRMPRRIFEVPDYAASAWLRRGTVELLNKPKRRKLARVPSKEKVAKVP